MTAIVPLVRRRRFFMTLRAMIAAVGRSYRGRRHDVAVDRCGG
jgi:hypothetical protein